MRLLLAEDERDLNRILTLRFREEGWGVDSCFDGPAALDCLEAAEYDGAVLDVMLPGMDGFAVLQTARERGVRTPVLFLTARDAVADRVRGLDLGAADYLIKPFSMDELLARVRALTRRTYGEPDSLLRAGDLTLDTASHTVRRGARQIELTAREFALLEYLMHNKNIVLSREKIEDHIWSFDYEGGTNLVDVYVSHLRRRLGDDGTLLRTVRGVGYQLCDGEGSGCGA